MSLVQLKSGNFMYNLGLDWFTKNSHKCSASLPFSPSVATRIFGELSKYYGECVYDYEKNTMLWN